MPVVRDQNGNTVWKGAIDSRTGYHAPNWTVEDSTVKCTDSKGNLVGAYQMNPGDKVSQS